jgi:hypothetical protein
LFDWDPPGRELTVPRKDGPLLTSLTTGDTSSRLVEAYRLHPNAIKALARCGQGYSLSDEALAPVAYPMMPAISADYALPRKDQKVARSCAQASRALLEELDVLDDLINGRSARSAPGRIDCCPSTPRTGSC